MDGAEKKLQTGSFLTAGGSKGILQGLPGGPSDQKSSEPGNDEKDAQEIYDKMEKIILPMYYKDAERWMGIMQHSIAFNAPFFNAQRMEQQYVLNAYLH